MAFQSYKHFSQGSCDCEKLGALLKINILNQKQKMGFFPELWEIGMIGLCSFNFKFGVFFKFTMHARHRT